MRRTGLTVGWAEGAWHSSGFMEAGSEGFCHELNKADWVRFQGLELSHATRIPARALAGEGQGRRLPGPARSRFPDG
jgi:hypothetical protein